MCVEESRGPGMRVAGRDNMVFRDSTIGSQDFGQSQALVCVLSALGNCGMRLWEVE